MYIHVFKINPRSLTHNVLFVTVNFTNNLSTFKLSYYLTVISGSKGDRHSMDTMDPTAETRHGNKKKKSLSALFNRSFQNKLKYK